MGDHGKSTCIYRMMLTGGLTSAAASSGGLVGGDASLWMIFSTALHLDLPLRDLAIRVVRSRYAIPVAA